MKKRVVLATIGLMFTISSFSQTWAPQSSGTNAGLSLYPNPTRNYVNLSVSNVDGTTFTTQIYNSVGQLIFSKTFDNDSFAVTIYIGLDGFIPGTYQVKIQGATKNSVQSLIIN